MTFLQSLKNYHSFFHHLKVSDNEHLSKKNTPKLTPQSAIQTPTIFPTIPTSQFNSITYFRL
jgi:hypothetical protein